LKVEKVFNNISLDMSYVAFIVLNNGNFEEKINPIFCIHLNKNGNLFGNL